MKKSFLFISALFFCFSLGVSHELEAKPIFQLIKSNGGLFGYSYSHWETVELGGNLGWSGTCLDPGWTKCKKPTGSGLVTDPVDNEVIFEMEEYADIEIANGRHSGSKAKRIQVAGEDFTRVYLVTWSATPVERRRRETVGDGQTVTINIDREDIQL